MHRWWREPYAFPGYLRLRAWLSLALIVFILVGGIVWGPNQSVPVQEAVRMGVPGDSMPIFYAYTTEPKVALTLDNSWGETQMEKVLNVLDQYDQKATFFLSSPWAEDHPQLVRRVVDDGHELASHGEAHDNLSQVSEAEIRRNLETADQTLKELSGQEPRYFRPPNGDYDDLVVETARSLGYETIIWSVDSLDWKNPGVDYMVRRITENVFPGAILLFHASDSAKQTDVALPQIITRLRASGYELMPLGELLDGAEPAREDPRGRPEKPNQG